MSWLNDLLQNDPDPTETREWIESIKAVIDAQGPDRAHQLLEGMVELTRRAGAHLPFAPTTEYINTIPPELEPGTYTVKIRTQTESAFSQVGLGRESLHRAKHRSSHPGLEAPCASLLSALDFPTSRLRRVQLLPRSNWPWCRTACPGLSCWLRTLPTASLGLITGLRYGHSGAGSGGRSFGECG